MNLAIESNIPEILFITSFPPRECGIATYTQDLVSALSNQFKSSFKCSICALESAEEQHDYVKQPKYILNTDDRNAFTKTALNINRDEQVKLVVVQHEFGFFAKKENEFMFLLDIINKPIVIVFHTVLPKPNDALQKKVYDMGAIASSVIVMTKDAAYILMNEYYIPALKITVIPHGTHLVPPLERKILKEFHQLSNRKVLSTFGLLSVSKSIETTLEALPVIILRHPEVLFLILGKTHPGVVKNEGEKYRNSLLKKVADLNIQEHVQFVNEYLPLHELLEYLQLTDIYLFTSKDPNQAVSGTLSYALSCGCPVIYTPIPHAREVVNDNNGILIDFENPEQLSRAVNTLLDDEKWRNKISSNSFQKMAVTAWQNAAITHALLFEKLTNKTFKINYRIPPLNLNHIKKMTTHFGMIQFANIATPDLHSGYTLDDNARALIVLCQHFEIFQNQHDLILIKKYLAFIKYCLQPNGVFLNYVTEEKVFSAQNYSENLEDSNGRAIWSLGYLISLRSILPTHLVNEATELLEIATPNLDKIHSTRAMAFIIKGLHFEQNKKNKNLLLTLANRLVQMYKHEKTKDWHWFEGYLTYGNSSLPEAMLCAYLSTEEIIYKEIAIESFDFLLSKIFVEGKIKVISNVGWHLKDKIEITPNGGEQPIDVAYTIMALDKFYSVFSKNSYKEKAMTAFNWFLGNNHLHQIMYNPCTGGCYDGLEAHNVNLNQGAESTLSYLMARLTMVNIKGPKKGGLFQTTLHINNSLVGIMQDQSDLGS
ncbi:MAG: glycosyltransferase [Sphingobacteriia bacterium]|jgi:glycosyltransferase involved in cell wall biosynthesis